MRLIAIINQKGGVGKTTISANLAHALALEGHSVTVVDMDPQSHLSASLGVFHPPAKGVDELLLGDADLDSVSVEARDGLKMVPPGQRLAEFEQLAAGGVSRGYLLRDALKRGVPEGDFIIFDCPPSSGLIAANVIIAADEVLIPVCGDYLSLNGVAHLLATMKGFEACREQPLRRWVVMSRFFPRRRLSRQVKDKLLDYFPQQVLATAISEAAVLAECPGMGRTVFEYRHNSKSAQEFGALARDLIEERTM